MKNIILATIMVGSLILMSSCGDTTTSRQSLKPYVPIVLTPVQTQQVQSDNSFAFDLMRNVNGGDTAKNVLISPLSVSLALAMTYNGAAGDTKTAMATAMRHSGYTTDEINDYYKKIGNALLTIDPSTQLKIANSIWTQKNFPVLQSFYDVNSSFYNASVQSLDFAQPNAKDVINNWCGQNTNGKIPTIIDKISDDVVMYLINAVYFKGIWATQFNAALTSDGIFASPAGSVSVKYMKQDADFNYFANDSVQCAELPYGNGAFSMVLMLPKTGVTVDNLLHQLNASTWNWWMANLSHVKLHVELPKFTATYAINLNDVLANMGMSVAFTHAADFTKINASGGLLISNVQHKAFIAVDEEGTEAAAVTSVEIGITAANPTAVIPFIVNRPFLLVIKEKSTGAILFMGKLLNPSV
jgi:serpin B